MASFATFRGCALSLFAAVSLCMPAITYAGQKLEVDLHKSRVYIFVGKTGLGHEHAVEGRLKGGSLTLGAKENAGRLEFDMASFRADTDAARKYIGLEGHTSESTRRQVNTNMLGPKVLNVKQYPSATFQIDSARMLKQTSRRGHPLAELRGSFTLHGVTRPIRVITEVIPEEKGTRVRGGFRILQTDYKIQPFRKAFGAIGVADELRIYGEIVLTPARQTAGAGSAQGGTRR